MMISRPQLADALITATHIAERNLIAAFIADAATQPASNPFPNTSVGAVRQIWWQRAAEFQSFDVQAAGLACLLTTLSYMSVGEALVQEIVRAGPDAANVFYQGARCQIVGAVLYDKAGHALPAAPVMPVADRGPRRRVRTAAGQLDLFM